MSCMTKKLHVIYGDLTLGLAGEGFHVLFSYTRGGIESISPGQYEAAEVLGYTKSQTFIKIILPQMVKNCLPSVTNEVITLVKDTSLAYAIGTVEIFTRAKQIVTAPNITFHSMLPFLVAGIFYYIFNFLVAGGMGYLEKRMNYYR